MIPAITTSSDEAKLIRIEEGQPNEEPKNNNKQNRQISKKKKPSRKKKKEEERKKKEKNIKNMKETKHSNT